MSGRRLALIVAVDRYEDAGLRSLAAPATDARALSEVLGDPERGDFEVETMLNPTSWVASQKIEEILASRQLSDLVLLHFSCHGIKDDSGELYIAATNTVSDRLASTAVAATWINRVMQRSRAQRVVLLLDCCFGGAFERGVIARAAGSVDVVDHFRQNDVAEGRGRAIITASTAMEYAFEDTRLTESDPAPPSVFTAALVEGIRSGDADRDADGLVSLGELYDYVYDRVRARSPRQTPCKWEFGVRGGLVIARNPRRRIVPGPLSPELVELVEHANAAVRLAAVEELGRATLGANLPHAAAARAALERLTDDDSRRVTTAALEALERTRLRLGTETVDFGPAEPGSRPLTTTVEVAGGPLAAASSVEVSGGPLQARMEETGLRVTWTPSGRIGIDEVVTLTGPAGRAQLRVTGRVGTPPRQDAEAPQTGADPSRTRPAPSAEPVPPLVAPRPSPSPPAEPDGGGGPHVRRWSGPTGRLVGAIVASLVVVLGVLVFIKTRGADPDPPPAATPLTGHMSGVLHVAFSPDGKLLASAGMDYSVRLWNVATGRAIGDPLTGHTNWVTSVAFAPNGSILASAGADNTVRLWDAASRQPLGPPLTGHTGSVNSVAFSPDGQMLASGGDDRSIRLWNVSTRQSIASITGHDGDVYGVSFSPDGKTVASSGVDSSVRMWDVAGRQSIGGPLIRGVGAVHSVAFGAGGTTLAGGRADGSIDLWNVGTRQVTGDPLTGHSRPVNSVAFSPDGGILVSGSRDGSVRLWTVASGGRTSRTVGVHTDAVNGVAFSPTGKTVASASDDRTVRLWDISSYL